MSSHRTGQLKVNRTCALASLLVRRVLAAGELAVGRPVRPGRVSSESLDLVFLVRLEVALEPKPVRITFVGEDVRRHPIEEPAVVARNHRTAWEFKQRVLQ